MIPSLPKLIGLIAIIWLIWTVFRVFETRQASIRSQDNKQSGDLGDDGLSEGSSCKTTNDENESVDLLECNVCLAWVSGENCGRQNCPY